MKDIGEYLVLRQSLDGQNLSNHGKSVGVASPGNKLTWTLQDIWLWQPLATLYTTFSPGHELPFLFFSFFVIKIHDSLMSYGFYFDHYKFHIVYTVLGAQAKLIK